MSLETMLKEIKDRAGEQWPDEERKRMEYRWELQRKAIKLLDLVVTEWESDPTSVQCFDSRLVSDAIDVSKKLKELVNDEGEL